MTKIVEVTEEEYLRLNQLNGFANQIMGNPKAAVLLEQAAKIVRPDIRTPRLEQEQAAAAPFVAITESLQKLNERMDAEAAARAEQNTIAAANAKRNEGIIALRKQGWNDAGIAEIEKVMTEKGIADPVDAAIVFERRYPPPTPSMPGSNGTFNFNETMHSAKPDEDIKSLLKTRGREMNGLNAISDKMISDVLADVRRQG